MWALLAHEEPSVSELQDETWLCHVEILQLWSLSSHFGVCLVRVNHCGNYGNSTVC